jgi:hypothetical protein
MNKSSSIDTENFAKFEYELSRNSDSKFGCIFLNQEIIYRIYDFNEFYKALGYTDEVNSNGILPEEYIWSEYHKDGAKKSDTCLQAKIIAYLLSKKVGLKYDFRKSYKSWIGLCSSEILFDSNDCCLVKILQNFNNCNGDLLS